MNHTVNEADEEEEQTPAQTALGQYKSNSIMTIDRSSEPKLESFDTVNAKNFSSWLL